MKSVFFVLMIFFGALVCCALGDDLPSGRLFGILQMSDAHAGIGREAGLKIAVISVFWDRMEPVQGMPDPGYIKEVAKKMQAPRSLGYQLMMDPGIQYPPQWVFSLPQARYKNQFGDHFLSKDPGAQLPNAVFNAGVRSAIASHFKNIFEHLGNDWDFVRIGGGKFGELNYPSNAFAGHSNCYWAFDDMAQGTTAGLPDGMAPCPVSGWVPGSPSLDHESARQFAGWYLDCLKDYQNWQIATVRRDYNGDICVLYGSWGIRPGELQAAIAGDLSGSTPMERNGEIQQGFDWPRMIDAIKDPGIIVFCTWMDGTLQNREIGDDSSPDPARWSPVCWQASLAKKHPLSLRVWGENTGHNTRATMDLTFKKIERFNLMGVLWAFDEDLFADPNPREFATFSDYANFIRKLKLSDSQQTDQQP